MKTRLKLLRALSHRPILILWSGEAFSAIGDEIYKVALIWLAVGMVGPRAGYLAAGQAAAVLIFSMLGGIVADAWDPRWTMIAVDVLRGLLVLIPVVWAQFLPLNLTLLVIVALLVSALGAFFEPALQAVVPRLTRERELMQATNGLMGTTARLARTVGPGIVGMLTGFISTIHFFTLDALSFGISAIAVGALGHELPVDPLRDKKRPGILQGLRSGFDTIRGDRMIHFVIFGKAVASGSWMMIIPLGIALLVQKILPGDVRAYGFLLAAYGAGNLAGALVLANVTMVRPIRVFGIGFAVMGLAFIAMAASPNLWMMMAFAALSAIGGPMNDLAHIDLIQRRYPPHALVRVVRTRMTVEFGGMLLCLSLAPALYAWLPVRQVIMLAGFATFLVGAAALIRFRDSTEDLGKI